MACDCSGSATASRGREELLAFTRTTFVRDRLLVVFVGLVGLGGAAAAMLAPCSMLLRGMALLLFGTAGLVLVAIGLFAAPATVAGCLRAATDEVRID